MWGFWRVIIMNDLEWLLAVNPGRDAWPMIFLKKLPQLLVSLLEQKHAQSLERLQLVSLEIHLISNDPALGDGALFRDIKVSRSDQLQKILSLKGDLYLDNIMLMQASVHYAVRDQKKFHKVSPYVHSKGGIKHFLSIKKEHVEEFFKTIAQSNSMFVDHNLMRLNGRDAALVPSQMLIFLLLATALKQENYQRIEISFITSIRQEQPLFLSYGHNELGFCANLDTEEGTAVSLQAMALL